MTRWTTGGTAGDDETAAIGAIRDLLERAGGAAPAGEVWIGDDAASVSPLPGGRLLLATDLVVGGVHVDLAWCTPEDAGFKALSATVSDIAAMGGRPRHALVSVAAPPDADPVRVMAGVADAVGVTGCPVVGGDLSASPVLVVAVAVAGVVDVGPGPLLRSGAGPGDTVFVTGNLGASAAGLRLLRTGGGGSGGDEGAAALREAHLRPRPRLDEGEAARLAGASAAIDISDGLLGDVGRLAVASGVGVDVVEVPVAPGASEDDALHGGEDYELVVTTGDPAALERAFAALDLRPPVAIGTCTAGSGVRLRGAATDATGWRHRFG
jgi:thiamine-monophosphate kinase